MANVVVYDRMDLHRIPETNVGEYGLFLISFEMKNLALPFPIEIEFVS